jgi:signal transduction histidine kinase
VQAVHWEGVQDEVVVDAVWTSAGAVPVEPGSLHHPGSGSPTLEVLESGIASRSEYVIAAPVITGARLLSALTAWRDGGAPVPPGAEVRLRSFADLAGQAIANERAQAELRASRARIVRAADETRQRLERNLHDGAQQRLVSLSLALRLVESKLDTDPAKARELLTAAHKELSLAPEELREIARGIHPAILTDRGLGPALEAIADRSAVPVELRLVLSESMPEDVQAAAYYVVAESLTNVSKHAQASRASVRARCSDGVAEIEVVDDGRGGADVGGGSGIRGLADRVEALGGRFGVDSASGGGTRVWAEIPLAAE